MEPSWLNGCHYSFAEWPFLPIMIIDVKHLNTGNSTERMSGIIRGEGFRISTIANGGG